MIFVWVASNETMSTSAGLRRVCPEINAEYHSPKSPNAGVFYIAHRKPQV